MSATGAVGVFHNGSAGRVFDWGEEVKKIPGRPEGLWAERTAFKEGTEKTFSIGKEHEQPGAILHRDMVGSKSWERHLTLLKPSLFS